MFVHELPLVLEVGVVPASETGVEDPLAAVALEAGAVPTGVGRFVDTLVAAVGRQSAPAGRRAVVQSAVEYVHPEAEDVTRFELDREQFLEMLRRVEDDIGSQAAQG